VKQKEWLVIVTVQPSCLDNNIFENINKICPEEVGIIDGDMGVSVHWCSRRPVYRIRPLPPAYRSHSPIHDPCATPTVCTSKPSSQVRLIFCRVCRLVLFNSFGKIKNSKPYYMLNNITTKINNNYKFRIKILNEL
jgi:hypothetical protein